MASLVLALRERRVIYLGRDTPPAEIDAAVRQNHVEAVLISISNSYAAARASRFLTELRSTLPTSVALWVGGSGAPSDQAGIERFDSLARFDERLARR